MSSASINDDKSGAASPAPAARPYPVVRARRGAAK
jgi:hypothetical protein